MISAAAALLLALQAAQPLSPFAQKKAETLLRDKLPCLGCHELGGDGGRIAPGLTDVAGRRDRDYVARMIADPQRTVPGTVMPRVVMPPETRSLIVAYLAERPLAPASGSPTPHSPLPLPRASTDTTGAGLYARYCAACHGATGNGDGPNARFLPVPPTRHADAPLMAQRADDVLYDAIAGGGGVMGKSPRMPPFGATLSDRELRALVRHIRTLCRCEGPAWSRDP